MARGVMADVAVRLRTMTSEFNKGLNKAKTKLNSFKENVQKTGRSIKKGFGQSAGNALSLVSREMGVMGDMLGGLGRALPGITRGMGAFKIALAGTGIGLIVVALGSLVAYLTQTKDGFEILTKVMDKVKGVFEAVLDTLAKMGGAIVKLFKGDFQGAWEDASAAVTGLDDKLEANWQKTSEISERKIKLKKMEIELAQKEGEYIAEIAELILKSREREKYSAQQREQFLKKAYGLQVELSDLKVAKAQEELAIQEDLNTLSENGYEEDLKTAELQLEVNKNLKLKSDKIREIQNRINENNGALQKELLLQQQITQELEDRYKMIQEVQTMSAIGPDGEDVGVNGIGSEEAQEDFDAANEKTQEYIEKQDEALGKIFQWEDYQLRLSDVFSAMAGSMEKALSSNENILKSFWTFFKDWIKGMLIKLAAVTAAALLASIALSALGIGSVGGLKGATGGLKGLFSGGQFGSILGGNMMQLGGGSFFGKKEKKDDPMEFQLQGDTLTAAQERNDRQKSNTL
jgi:hypothetical protein